MSSIAKLLASAAAIMVAACQVDYPAYNPTVRFDGGLEASDDAASISPDDVAQFASDAKALPEDANIFPVPDVALLSDTESTMLPDAPIVDAMKLEEPILPPAANFREGLVGYWPLDKDTGGLTNDHSGLGNHGIVETQPPSSVWRPGKFDQAAAFTGGTGPAIRIGSSLSLNSVDKTLTVAAWIAPQDTSSPLFNTIFSRQRGDYNQDEYDLTYRGNSLHMYMFDRTNETHADVSTSFVIPSGQWVHVASTYDGSRLRLYVNGQLRRSSAVEILLTPSAKPVFIGTNINRGNDGRRETMDGLIDEVLLYSRALSGAEIADLAARTQPLWR